MLMNCERCAKTIREDDRQVFRGQVLCEDCYMDALSPPRTCDPWAVHSAKSTLTTTAGSGGDLTETQGRILAFLKETGGAAPGVMAEALGMKAADLERDIAALRHMEKVRARLQDGEKVICLW